MVGESKMFVVIALFLLSACAVVHDEEVAYDEEALSWSDEAEPAEHVTGDDALTELDAAEDGVSALAGTWVYWSTESCWDLQAKPCTQSSPPVQCPGARRGAPCPRSVTLCWKVLDAGRAELYSCR